MIGSTVETVLTLCLAILVLICWWVRRVAIVLWAHRAMMGFMETLTMTSCTAARTITTSMAAMTTTKCMVIAALILLRGKVVWIPSSEDQELRWEAFSLGVTTIPFSEGPTTTRSSGKKGWIASMVAVQTTVSMAALAMIT